MLVVQKDYRAVFRFQVPDKITKTTSRLSSNITFAVVYFYKLCNRRFVTTKQDFDIQLRMKTYAIFMVTVPISPRNCSISEQIVAFYSYFEKGFGKSVRDHPERYFRWFCVHSSSSRKFERVAREATDVCLRVLKESSKSRFDSSSVRNSVLIISHNTFRDCLVHIFSDNLSRSSCIQSSSWLHVTALWIGNRIQRLNKHLLTKFCVYVQNVLSYEKAKQIQSRPFGRSM